MNEDEKKAIELTNNFIEYFNKNIQDGNRADLTVLGEEIEAIIIILNLIENQQKEIEELKSKHYFINGLRCGKSLMLQNLNRAAEFERLKKENEYLKVHYQKSIIEQNNMKLDLKYVLNQTLGAFQNNWCIDWNFTEIREKYNIESEE